MNISIFNSEYQITRAIKWENIQLNKVGIFDYDIIYNDVKIGYWFNGTHSHDIVIYHSKLQDTGLISAMLPNLNNIHIHGNDISYCFHIMNS